MTDGDDRSGGDRGGRPSATTGDGLSRRAVAAVSLAWVAGLVGAFFVGPGAGHAYVPHPLRDYEVRPTTPDRERSGIGPPFSGDGPSEAPPVAAFAVGRRADVHADGVRPHSVVVWNDADRRRELPLRLRVGGRTVLDRRVPVPADGTATLDLREPGPFVLETGHPEPTAAVELADFDCNYRVTGVRVGADGTVKDRTLRTTAQCGWPLPVPDR